MTLEPSQGTSTVSSPFPFQPEEGDRSSLRSNVYFEPGVMDNFHSIGHVYCSIYLSVSFIVDLTFYVQDAAFCKSASHCVLSVWRALRYKSEGRGFDS